MDLLGASCGDVGSVVGAVLVVSEDDGLVGGPAGE